MKIIDFETKGNLVRFYLGENDCYDYWGDDWDDRPYEHNAGLVYERYVSGYADIIFPFDYCVYEPESDWHYQMNSPFCKEDFKKRLAPCIVASKEYHFDSCYSVLGLQASSYKFFFEDHLEPGTYLFNDGEFKPI